MGITNSDSQISTSPPHPSSQPLFLTTHSLSASPLRPRPLRLTLSVSLPRQSPLALSASLPLYLALSASHSASPSLPRPLRLTLCLFLSASPSPPQTFFFLSASLKLTGLKYWVFFFLFGFFPSHPYGFSVSPSKVLCSLLLGFISLKLLSEMESASVPSNERASTTGSNANSSSVRAKCDPAWDHVTEELKDGRSSYRCIHCGKTYKGGGINRMKRHLAGIKGDVAACMGVPYDVRFQMVENLKEISKSKEQTKKDQEASNYSPLEDSPEFEDVQEITPRGRGLGRGNRSSPSNFPQRSNLGKRKVGDIGNYFAPRTTPGAQPSIKSVLAGKEKKRRVDMAVARWMYDACIPINAVNSSYYQPMFNAVASYGPGYRGPNYHALRVPLLREAKREVQLIVDSHRSYWADTGCTIMADGWTDTRHRTLINFLVYCPKGPTRFATTFIALGSLKEHKHDLQALVTSKFYVESKYAKDKKAKAVVKIILDNQFWNDCHVIVHIMSPLIRLLRIVDSDEKPAMGYVYDGMYRVIDGIKKIFKDKKRLWEPYVNIIKDRWDNQFYRDIHAAAYWLNPAFQYDTSTLNKRLETQSAVTDVIESKVSVDEWWKLFGSCAPTLQKFAIRILSQTAASSGCERNWSAFEQIHTKRRNRLEHQRLNDLVFVHYNYRLKERVKRKKFNFDPIDYASIDKTEFWVVEDEEPPFLDHEEIENALYEEGAYPIEEGSSSHVQRDMDNEVIEDDDDDINLESFGDEDDAPPGFRDKNHPIHVEVEEDEDEDDDDDASGGAFGSHDDIDFNFLHNK
uniref:BED-type domain-containing protein n=1 Tax=Quercus lobata TaxID=97700 RepID=A0A7N2R4S6_QUELO